MRTLALALQPVSDAQARWLTRERVVVLFWLAAIATVIVMATTSPAGWDARNCLKAVQSLRHGGDPYAEGIAAQEAFHNRPTSDAAEHAPLTYVYSPLTLPVLRLLSALSDRLLALFFWAAVAAGSLLTLWAGFEMATEEERPWLALLLPAVAFFPGLITDDVILSGNIAYILYGPILASAILGWKRDRWFWYYFAVLAASICKAPFLTLLALPVLVGKRQWIPAGSTAAAGLFFIAAQARLWPALFSEYVSVLRLMCVEAHDFGYGPAGVLGRFLWNRGWPYSSETTILYLAFAGSIGLILLYLVDQVRQENISRDALIPVAVVGTVLLNPRIMKYDMAAITIPMLLIAARGLRAVLQNFPVDDQSKNSNLNRLVVVGGGCFLIPNLLTVFGPTSWPVEMMVMLTTFGLGALALHNPNPQIYPQIPPSLADTIGDPAFEIPGLN